MSKPMGRPKKDPTEVKSKVIAFRVKGDVWANIESSTAGETIEFWRDVAEKISEAVESGATGVYIPLAPTEGYQTIATGGTDETTAP